MRIIINCSNLYVGGGIQVALSFINELKKLDFDHQYFVFLSPLIASQIEKTKFKKNFKFYLIQKSPASVKHRFKVVKELNNYACQIKPDIVFTVFGPAYWNPKSLHLMGFALGWLTNPSSIAYNQLNPISRIRKRLENNYKKYYLKKEADFLIVETDDVKKKLKKNLNIPEEIIFIVGNTFSSYFNRRKYKYLQLPEKSPKTFRLVTISHNYPHKNLRIIKKVVPYLNKDKLNFEFILTIDQVSYSKLFKGYENNVINIGPIAAEYCPSIYIQSDALFLPTLLESFTASYPEAMKMGLPILTSNYTFAKDICGNAALYFDPLNPKDISEEITKLSNNINLQKRLIEKGKKRLSSFETAKSRAEKYIKICEQIVNQDYGNE